MIIDIHTHTFPAKIASGTIDKLSRTAHIEPHVDGTEAGLKASMKQAGVDISVILPVATAARQVQKVNDASARINEREAREAIPGEPRLLSLGCMHPDFEGYYEELARMKDLGLHGFKIHPVYQDVNINDIRYLRIFERAAELGFLVITHAGDDIGFPGAIRCHPRMCREVIDTVGDFPFILAHMGGWRNWEEVAENLAGTKAYIDTAFSGGAFTPLADGHYAPEETEMLTADAFTEIIRAFGADRVLFGTDSPWAGQKESLAFLQGLPLTSEEKKKILGDNALRLLSR